MARNMWGGKRERKEMMSLHVGMKDNDVDVGVCCVCSLWWEVVVMVSV